VKIIIDIMFKDQVIDAHYIDILKPKSKQNAARPQQATHILPNTGHIIDVPCVKVVKSKDKQTSIALDLTACIQHQIDRAVAKSRVQSVRRKRPQGMISAKQTTVTHRKKKEPRK